MTENEAQEKLLEAAKTGRVELKPGVEESIRSMNVNNPDFTVTKVELGNVSVSKMGRFCISVDWQTVSAGFGSVAFYSGKRGELRCDNEGMSVDFVKEVMAKFVDLFEMGHNNRLQPTQPPAGDEEEGE